MAELLGMEGLDLKPENGADLPYEGYNNSNLIITYRTIIIIIIILL